MIIESGTVGMASLRTYKACKKDSVSYSGWGSHSGSFSTDTATTLPAARESVQNLVTVNQDTERFFVSSSLSKLVLDGQEKVEYESLKNSLEFLSGKTISVTKTDFTALFRRLFYQRREAVMERLFGGNVPSWNGKTVRLRPTQSFGMASGQTVASYEENHYYEEEENTEFYSSGTVKTADGRSIDFDIGVELSRSFQKQSHVKIDYKKAYQIDPLVINLEDSSAEVTDQKFLFDLDCDGELDSISILAGASGFLALDKNGDGIINDGSELFGTGSGDGFGELAVFDLDGNGWIDENDPVFDRLRIWTKAADGTDKLIGLGIAGVGAIYLGNIDTAFSLNSQKDNQSLGSIQSTGIYLKENGQAGTIQHVDFAMG